MGCQIVDVLDYRGPTVCAVVSVDDGPCSVQRCRE